MNGLVRVQLVQNPHTISRLIEDTYSTDLAVMYVQLVLCWTTSSVEYFSKQTTAPAWRWCFSKNRDQKRVTFTRKVINTKQGNCLPCGYVIATKTVITCVPLFFLFKINFRMLAFKCDHCRAACHEYCIALLPSLIVHWVNGVDVEGWKSSLFIEYLL